MTQFHLFLVWVILAVGGVSLISGVTLLITRWRSLAPTSATATTAADGATTARADTPATTTPGAAPVGPPAPITGLARVFRWSLIAAAALGALQALVGGVLYLSGARPPDPLHYVYGAIVLLAIPVAYVYSDQKRGRRDFIIMTIALVLLIGAAVRAFMTGGGLH